jgi:hypothetical protein
LARLLRAWCIEHDGRLGSRSLFATLLRAAAQADAPEVLRFVAEGNFRSLSDAARYALMARTKDAELVAELLVREAELTKDKKRAGDLAWQVHESGRLGDARLDWACQVWQRAGQAERVIQTCEAALRQHQRRPQFRRTPGDLWKLDEHDVPRRHALGPRSRSASVYSGSSSWYAFASCLRPHSCHAEASAVELKCLA